MHEMHNMADFSYMALPSLSDCVRCGVLAKLKKVTTAAEGKFSFIAGAHSMVNSDILKVRN